MLQASIAKKNNERIKTTNNWNLNGKRTIGADLRSSEKIK